MNWYYIKYNNNIPRKRTNQTMAKLGIMGPMSPLAAPGRHTVAFPPDKSGGARNKERMGALYMAQRKLGLNNRPEAPEAAQVSIPS